MTKLYRSRTDSKLFGLCGGLAQMINVDSTLLRVIVIITAFFSGGTVILLYFIACLVIPKEPVFDFHEPHNTGPYYGPNYTSHNGYGNPNTGRNTGYYGSSTNSGTAAGHTTGYQSGASRPFGGQPAGFSQPPQPGQPFPPREASVDEMMRDMEKKMLQREIDELREKLAQYELKNRDKGGSDGGQE